LSPISALDILTGLVAGLVLGAAFFGGLWWTLSRIPGARRPALLATGSLLLRLAVVAAGLLWSVRAGPDRLIACLAGLLVAREILKRRLRPATADLAAVRDPADRAGG
jgi:F1F0 ATPase subunit 2